MASRGNGDDAAIASFWSWFASVADRLEVDFQDSAFHEALDERLAVFGDVTWELGGGQTKPNMLAVSPDGFRELLPLTRRIVAAAPQLPRWEILPARPARYGCLQFSLRSSDGAQTPIDARPWRYVLFRFPDGTFDIVVEQPNLRAVSEDDRFSAAYLILDFILGEETRLLRVGDVEPVLALTAEQAHKASPIHVLARHFASLEDE